MVSVRMLYYMDDKINENEKNTRGTVGEGIPTVGKQEEKKSRKERFVDMVKETEVEAATFCVLAFVLGL